MTGRSQMAIWGMAALMTFLILGVPRLTGASFDVMFAIASVVGLAGAIALGLRKRRTQEVTA